MKNQIYVNAFILSVLFLQGTTLYSQEFNADADENEQHWIYKNQWALGAFLHSEGWGVFYRKEKIVSIYNKRFWEIETATMHNPKEVKQQNSVYPDASSYYFGKLNGMQVFRFGEGYSTTLARKANLRHVEIDVVYSGGLSLSVTKPVYLEIIENPNMASSDSFILSTEEYNPQTDTPSNIYGRASVFDGLEELRFYPGLYGRGGFNFDFASKHTKVKAIETGLEVDAYPEVIPIMAFAKNYQFFFDFYISFSFGGRWNSI